MSGGGGGGGSGGGQSSHVGEPGLGVTYQITRRSSAYDVYSTTGSSGGGLNAMAIAAAQQQMQCSRDLDSMYTKRSSISGQGKYFILWRFSKLIKRSRLRKTFLHRFAWSLLESRYIQDIPRKVAETNQQLFWNACKYQDGSNCFQKKTFWVLSYINLLQLIIFWYMYLTFF